MTAPIVVGMLLVSVAIALLPRPRAGPPRRVREATGHPGRVPPPLVAAVASGAAAAFLLGGLGPGAYVAAVAVAAVVHRVVGRLEPAASRRRREALARELPLAVDLLAAALEAGQPPSRAVATLTEVLDGAAAEVLAESARSLALGVDPVSVWSALGAHPQLGPLGRALARATESGAPVAEALDRLADDLRSDRRARVEARARAVGVRASLPLGVCLLPAFVVLGVVPLVVGSLAVVLPH